MIASASLPSMIASASLRRRPGLTRTTCAASFSTHAQGVHNLLHRFFHILDGVDTESSLGQLFMEPGQEAGVTISMHIPKAGLILQTREDIDAWCVHMHKRWTTPTLHIESNVILQDHGETVVNHSYWTALQNGAITAYGTHADVLQRQQDGEWRFWRRVIRHIHPA